MGNDKDRGKYNPNKKGFETKDGGLIRVQDKKNDGNVRISIYDGDATKKGEHDRTTINYNEKTGQGTIDYHSNDKSDKTSVPIGCYLTTACMRHYLNDFDDNCYELTVLRWFRDNFVSAEDIDHYYKIAPYIVAGIDEDTNPNLVYDYIYDNIVDACVTAIENGDYEFAYNRYKNSILKLEEAYARKIMQNKLIRTLKKQII